MTASEFVLFWNGSGTNFEKFCCRNLTWFSITAASFVETSWQIAENDNTEHDQMMATLRIKDEVFINMVDGTGIFIA